MKSTFKINLNTRGQITVLIAIASIIVAIGGYFIYSYQANNTLQKKEKILTAIATLKSKQLSAWFLEELYDIQIIASDPYLTEEVFKFTISRSLVYRSIISDFLSFVGKEHGYNDVIIVSADEKIEIWDGEQLGVLNEVELQTIEKALSQKKSLSTDLFRHESNGEEKIYISFISTIKDVDNNVLAVLIGRLDASLTVYPIIEEWPIPSQTAESSLFKVENDSIVYLNNLKHNNNAALNLRIPVRNTELLASQAVSGKLGLVSGKDYRNENVTGFVSKIEGTPWYLISEIDDSEMYQGKYVIAGVVAGFALLLIFIIIFFIGTIFSRRQKNIYKELYIKEKEVWQQQEKFKVTMDSLGEGVIVTDMDAKVQYINKHAEALTGWNYSDALGRNLVEIYLLKNEETGEKENNILEKVIKHGIVKELANHTLLVTKSGKEIPIMDTGAPIFDNNGSLTGIVITFQDETEKRTQNRLLKESEKKFRVLATSIPQKIFFKDCESTYVYCNENFAKDLGISENEITGKSDYDFFPTELADKYRDDDRKILEKGETITLEEDYIANDVLQSVRTTKIPVKDENEKAIGLFGIFEDISESKRAQVALLKSEKNLREFFENDITGDYAVTADGEILSCNPSFALILGYSSPDELVGRNIIEFYRDQIEREKSLKIIQASKILKDFEVILKHKDGSEIFCKENIVGVFDESGSLIRYFGYLQDITEQKVAKDKLQIREQLLSSVMNTQQELICRFLPDTTLTFVNKAYCKLFGKTEKDLIGSKFLQFVPESEWEHELSILSSLNTNNPQRTTVSKAYRADGSEITLEFTDTAIFNEEGETVEFQTVGRDITEKLKTLNELIVAKKKAEESEKNSREFFENDISGDYAATADGEILKCNPAFAYILGYSSPDELVGRNILEFYRDQVDREEFIKIIQVSKIINGFEIILKHKDGSEIFCKENIVGVFDESGSFVRYFGYLQDITDQKEAEEKLKNREQLLSSVMNTQQELICRFLPDTTLTFVNKAYCKLFGVTEKERIGSKFLQFLPESEWEYELSHLRRLNTNNPQRTTVSKRFRADGSEIILEWTDIAIFNEKGEVVEFQAVGHDITEKLKAEQEIIYNSQMQELLRDISASYIHIPIDQFDNEIQKSLERIGRFVEADRVYIFDYDWFKNTCSNTFEWCQDGIEPQIQVLQNIPLDLIPQWTNPHRNGQALHIPDVLKLDINDGVRQILEPQGVKSLLTIPIMSNYECIGFLGFDSVIKHHSYTQSEEQFLLFFAQLILNIRNRQLLENSLVLEKEKAEESDKLKTAFINNISHEIRTPLNGILGFGQFLVESDLSVEEHRDYFEHVEKSSNRLMNTVSDYMDMAMLVSNTMKANKKEFTLKPVFETISAKAKQLFLDKSIDFKVEIPIESAGLTVNSDPEFIQKIFDKLLDNAVKFTEEGSIICGYKIKTEHIEFFVKDTGSGIKNDMQELIFEMFRQENSAMTRGHEGSGLGLTIANGLVKILGGEITVASEKGKGSAFTFTIPIKNSGKSISPDATAATKPMNTKTPLILIAEDIESNYDYLAIVLKSLGYNHIRAVNGKEAVDFCRQNPEISIVLMDIKMPVMNGDEATRQIRTFLPELPIIATTAHAQTGDEHRFLEVGCNDYIAKPIRREKLLSIIRKYIE